MTDEEYEAVYQAMSALERPWLLPLPQTAPWHGYDPLPLRDFFNGVRIAARLTPGRRFLDVGCGIGTKLLLMDRLGWQTAGIERHPPYADRARELNPNAQITTANLLEIRDIDADVIYMNRPAMTDELEEQVEAHMLAHANLGTVMFWPYRHQPQVWTV